MSSKVEKEQINKPAKQIGLQVKLPGCSEFVLLENFNAHIFDIKIEELEIFKEFPIYNLFQICKYYNIDFNDLIVRQQIRINTSGDCNFNIDVNVGNLNGKLLGQKCNCILCSSDFIAIRRTIKVCNSKHFFNCIDIYSGFEYEKEVQKWNFIYKEDEISYIEGKSYSCKSNQVSANNMMTLFNHTNKMKNMTIEKRLEIVEGQKERGVNFVACASYEERAIVNSIIAKNRVKKIIQIINENINDIKLDDKVIKYDELDYYENKSGVWSIWGTNITTDKFSCLTVGQTINICKELKWTLRVILNKNLQKLEKIEPGCTGRWNKIQELYHNYEYKIILDGEESFDQRELIEAIYAIKNDALYWLPSATQISTNFYYKINELKSNKYLEGVKL